MAEGSHADGNSEGFRSEQDYTRHYRTVDEASCDWDDTPMLSRRRPDWDERLDPRPITCTSTQRQSARTPICTPNRTPNRTPIRTPDRFDGKTSWVNYWAHFQSVMEMQEWNEDTAVQQLASSLRDSACRVLYPKPMTEDGKTRTFLLSELVQRLNRKYGPGGMAENYLCQIKQRQQKREESLIELAEDVQQLATLAYPEAPAHFLERLTISHFKDAVRDGDVRAAIHRHQPVSLESALTAALDAENWNRMERERKQVSVRSVGETFQPPMVQPQYITKAEVAGLLKDQQQGFQDTLTKLVKDLKIGNKRGNKRRPLLCWSCNKEGHRAAECTSSNFNGPHHAPQWEQPNWMGPTNAANYPPPVPNNTTQQTGYPPYPPPQVSHPYNRTTMNQ